MCREPIPAHHPQSGYVIHKIPVEDTPTEDLLIHLPAACQFIDNAMRTPGAVVLVHCVQGLSRSACVVAAYSKPAFVSYFKSLLIPLVMWSRRLSVTNALAVVRQGLFFVFSLPL